MSEPEDLEEEKPARSPLVALFFTEYTNLNTLWWVRPEAGMVDLLLPARELVHPATALCIDSSAPPLALLEDLKGHMLVVRIAGGEELLRIPAWSLQLWPRLRLVPEDWASGLGITRTEKPEPWPVPLDTGDGDFEWGWEKIEP